MVDASTLDKVYVLLVGLTVLGGFIGSSVGGVVWLNRQFKERDTAAAARFKERDAVYAAQRKEADNQARAARALLNARVERLEQDLRAHDREVLNLRNEINYKLAFIPNNEQIQNMLDNRLSPMATQMQGLLRELARLGMHDARIDFLARNPEQESGR